MGGITVESDVFQQHYGEPLAKTLDLDTWKPGEDLSELYGRLETEVREALVKEKQLRERVREIVFPLLSTRPNRPTSAGVYQPSVELVQRVHNGLLFNGAVEACDGTSVVHDTLPLTIAQIGVSLVSYRGDQGTWVQRLFRRDLRVSGQDPVDETMEILERRKKRSDPEGKNARDKLTELGRRGIMAYAERSVLLNKSSALWRMGHGNPAPYELLTGSGMPELLEKSLGLLRELIEGHERIVFVPSGPSDRVLLTVGNALNPLEYAIVDTMQDSLERIVSRGHYTGQWGKLKSPLEKFAREVGSQIIVGVYRASKMAPAQVFYTHAKHAHEGALIAIGDSTLQEHRGFPMLIDLADRVCSSTFGAETLMTPTQLVYADAGEPYRHMAERQSRS